MTQYVKPALLILVLFLIGIGKIIKSLLLGPTTGWITHLIQRIFKTTSRILYQRNIGRNKSNLFFLIISA